MRNRSKLLLVAMTVAIALAFAVGMADASRSLEIEPNSSVSVIYERMVLNGGAGTITCEVTLHASLHRSIPKTSGTLTGIIESVLINTSGCRESAGVGNVTDVRVLSLPWHIRYVSFTGALPEITSVRLIILNMQILYDFEILGGDARCLYRTDQQADARFEEGMIRRVGLVREAATRPLRPPSTSNCPEASFSGEGSVSPTVTVVLFRGDWTIREESREDGAGRTRIDVTIERVGGDITIGELVRPTSWTVEGLDCIRAFRRTTTCSFRALSELNARSATKTMLNERRAESLNIVLQP